MRRTGDLWHLPMNADRGLRQAGDVPFDDLLQIARSVAEEAAALADRLRREGVEVAATKSSPIDIVTAADRAAEDLIRTRLAALRPDDGFLGEESGGATGSSGLTWVVDPIDGTVNYLYDLPNWSVSIAVVEGDPDPATWTSPTTCSRCRVRTAPSCCRRGAER